MLETSQSIVWSAVASKSMGASSVSDWMAFRKEFNRATIQIVWTGAGAQGAFYVEGRVGQKRSYPLPMAGKTADPDGTVYAGSLAATDLDAEALGEAVIRLADFGCDEIRLGYARTAGTGTMIAVVTFKPTSGVQPLDDAWYKEVVVTNLADNATHDIFLPTHIYHHGGSVHVVMSDGTVTDDITLTAFGSNDGSSHDPSALAYGDNSVAVLGGASITNAGGPIDQFVTIPVASLATRWERLRYQRTAGVANDGDMTLRVVLW